MLSPTLTSSLYILLSVTSVSCIYDFRNLTAHVEYFDQRIDHFNLGTYGTNTFKQKYLINYDYWTKDGSNYTGPILFYCGNEGNIGGFWYNSGFMFNLAEEYKGLVIMVEHRFYGTSLPFGEKSFEWPYIGLLTMEQALADFAMVINYIKNSKGAEDSKVIVFGGSYGGQLAAYMRYKYPNIVDGALAASAPVIDQSSKEAQESFWPLVTKDFNEAKTNATPRIQQAFADLEKLKQQEGGYAEISNQLYLCKPITDESGYIHVLKYVRNIFTNLAMYDYPYETSFVVPNLMGHPVEYTSQLIVNASTPIEGLKKAAKVIYQGEGTPDKCFDLDTLYVVCSDPTGCGTGNAAIAWDFQECIQLAITSGSSSKTSMFPDLPFTMADKTAYCKKKFNAVPDPLWTKTEFWGSKMWSASNIIFSNGLLDPWRGGGILEANPANPTISVILIAGAAHHLDLRPPNPLDPPAVTAARKLEAKIIGSYLSQ